MFGDFSNFNANPVAAAEKPYGHTALTYPTYLQPPYHWGQSLLEKACDFYVMPIKIKKKIFNVKVLSQTLFFKFTNQLFSGKA